MQPNLTPKFGLFFRVLACCLLLYSAQAQQFKFSQGFAITQFQYQNNQGKLIDGLKSCSGLAFQLVFHKASLVDTTKQKLESGDVA